MPTQKNIDRRSFVKEGLKAGAITSLALTGFPAIVPASVCNEIKTKCLLGSGERTVH